LEFAGTVKIGGCDTFSKCKSQGGGYRVSYGSPLKLSSRAHFYGGYMCKIKRYRVDHKNQREGRIQNFEVFGLLRDCRIYRGPTILVR
jgi:hypothetical protein